MSQIELRSTPKIPSQQFDCTGGVDTSAKLRHRRHDYPAVFHCKTGLLEVVFAST